jgi:hypothetical protein
MLPEIRTFAEVAPITSIGELSANERVSNIPHEGGASRPSLVVPQPPRQLGEKRDTGRRKAGPQNKHRRAAEVSAALQDVLASGGIRKEIVLGGRRWIFQLAPLDENCNIDPAWQDAMLSLKSIFSEQLGGTTRKGN